MKYELHTTIIETVEISEAEIKRYAASHSITAGLASFGVGATYRDAVREMRATGDLPEVKLFSTRTNAVGPATRL